MTSFSPNTFDLLGELAKGRDKTWFDANRSSYEDHLLEPLRNFVAQVGPVLRKLVPDLEISPKVNKTITRINRDMRFAKGQSPYKDNMLALFYREGRKREDAQLFLGLQPSGSWMGLYVPTPLLEANAPIAAALKADADAVLGAAKASGVGKQIELIACKKYGEVDRKLDPQKPDSFLQGPHLCALMTHKPEEIAANPDKFVAQATDVLSSLVPLWRVYSGAAA